MQKRIPYLFFMLMASIVLVAHAFVPHHHHNNTVCILTVHTETECCDHEHDTHENHYHHQNETDEEHEEGDVCCLLKEAVALTINNTVKIENALPVSQLLEEFSILRLELRGEIRENILLKKRNNAPPVYFINFYEYLCSGSTGLRAPPVV